MNQCECSEIAPRQAMARQGVAVAPTAHANWRSKPMGHRNYTRRSVSVVLTRRERDAKDVWVLPRNVFSLATAASLGSMCFVCHIFVVSTQLV